MQLAAYLDRIGHTGPIAPDLATLESIVRAHIATVPFENLDVQLDRPVGIGLDSIFAKIVGARRGGWCFEQNGLLGWALGEIGFEVRRISAGVMRVVRGDMALGNHLALIVMLDGQPWLVDVGFGGSQAAPLPLREGERLDTPFAVSLTEANGWWRFAERAGEGDPFSFDFRAEPADEALLAARCAALQADPESVFVQNLVVQQRQGDRHLTLRGRVFSIRSAEGEEKKLVDSADEFVTLLGDRFGLNLPEAAGLWDKVCVRHELLFAKEDR
ncbi:arylamine N-acetyltransferase [Sphingomonas sp. LB-2]|uniref:arylamine N-acetyltransferase family protein n=1 Tax=Sphingomonas caeni TaxID=2984949 RepID=UPI00222EFD46|nr:arylamine N-acetyltransferase [Sphingomonas caeni]MCW3845880.1 arylamine N-acetyltransferase [Sphingomonas caeni]